jgi:SAM-dependent methyltransferase
MCDPASPIDHGKVLDEEHQASFQPRATLIERIEAYRARRGLERKDMRVLDWGCGRGRTAFWLREQGYDAHGADVDGRPILNGRHLARSRGLDAEHVLAVIDEKGRTPYPDGYFHFICSDQVFEHVADMDLVAAEMARLLAPGGGGAHLYGATFLIVEGHLDMPFVHWLPKNRLRYWLIRLWVALGVEAKLPDYAGRPPQERARKFYEFTVNQTHYRTVGQVERAFRRAGIVAYADTIQSSSVRRHPAIRPLLRVPGLERPLNWVLSRCVSTHIIIAKPGV